MAFCEMDISPKKNATGTVGDALVSEIWRDANGNVVKAKAMGSKAITKTVFDGLNRDTRNDLVHN